MLRSTIIFIFLLSALFLTSCESNSFTAEIQNNSSDTIQVNYIDMKSGDSLFVGGGPNFRPDTFNGAFDEKYDSVTQMHTFFIAPGKTCNMAHTMNEDFELLSKTMLLKRLDIINGKDTIITARNRGTVTIFEKIEVSGTMHWRLVID